MPEEIDWKTVPPDVAREIKNQGETYLSAQMTAALAADQRATTMGSVVATVAAAVAAGSVAYWDKTASNPALVSGIITGAWLMISAGFCMWAARPINFFFPGNQPAHWFDCLGASLSEALGGEAENYQSHIESNDIALGKHQVALKRAGWLAVTAPVVAVVSFFAAEFIYSFCPG